MKFHIRTPLLKCLLSLFDRKPQLLPPYAKRKSASASPSTAYRFPIPTHPATLLPQFPTENRADGACDFRSEPQQFSGPRRRRHENARYGSGRGGGRGSCEKETRQKHNCRKTREANIPDRLEVFTWQLVRVNAPGGWDALAISAW